MEKIRDRMRELRESAGLSQRRAAEMMGWNRETYRKKEIGALGVTGPDLAHIARAYNTTISEAFPEYVPTEDEVAFAEDLEVV